MGNRRKDKFQLYEYGYRHRDNGSNDYEIMRTLVGLTFDLQLNFGGFCPTGLQENARCAWATFGASVPVEIKKAGARDRHSCHSRTLEV